MCNSVTLKIMPFFYHFFHKYLKTRIYRHVIQHFCPPLSQKHGDIKSHSSVCHSVRPSVTKTLTLGICTSTYRALILACVFLVTRPFRRYHVVTLTVTFKLFQGQICCRAGDHNSLNLLVLVTPSPKLL